MPFRIHARRVLAGLTDNRAVVLSSAYSLGLRIGGGIVVFGLGVILARHLGPVEYGIYGLITTLVGLATIVALVGTQQLAVRELSLRRAREDWSGVKGIIFEFNRTTTSVAIGLGAIAILVAYLFAGGRNEIMVYAAQGAALTLCLTLTAIIGAELRGLGELLRGQLMDIFGRPGVTFVLTLAFVLVGWRLTVVDALWIQVGVAAVAVWISFVWIRAAIPQGARSVERAKKIPWAGAAVALAAVDILRQLDGAYGVILMGWLSGGAELGLFRVAVACGVIVNMPITIAHVLFGPTASRLFGFGELDELQKLLSTISVVLVAAILPMTIVIWFFGRQIMELVFGPAYANAWLPLFFIACAQLATACFGLGPTLLAMCDSERHLVKICAVSVVVGVISAIPLVIRFGAAGAGAATIVSALLIAVFSQRFARRSLNLDPSLLSWKFG